MTSTRAPRARPSAVTKAANAGTSSRKVWIIVAVVLVVGFAAIMAIALAQEESTGSSGNQFADVTVNGNPLPPFQSGAPSAAIGLEAPELSGTSLTGEAMTIGNDGRPKVIGFFTHWCPACQAEVPEVSQWYNSGDVPDDVDLVAVNTAVSPGRVNYPPSAWFDRENWEVPTLLDDLNSSAAAAFGLSAYPFWAVVDADGRVVNQLSGQIGIDQLLGLMDEARSGAPEAG
jgi:thiol-disulfide isomerase/thioredoxin